jgi:hypothetical protein
VVPCSMDGNSVKTHEDSTVSSRSCSSDSTRLRVEMSVLLVHGHQRCTHGGMSSITLTWVPESWTLSEVQKLCSAALEAQ